MTDSRPVPDQSAANVNPAHPRLTTLICHNCDGEYAYPDDLGNLKARELGDGHVCVTCPRCNHDLAVFQ